MSTGEDRSAVSVLVVEDSRIQAQILSDKLRQAGYVVSKAENGQIGLEMIREQRPTIVISDIEMPKMTGYELCKAVKSDGELRSIPFILLSTLADAEDIIKGLHCGADNYVTKPYDPDFLIGRVASLLESPLNIGDEEDQQQLEVTLGGAKYTVRAGRQQVLNLLVSTFENAVEKNQELIRSNEELSIAKEQLTQWNQDLEQLNKKLDATNARMTRDLDAAAKVQQSLLPSGDSATPGFVFGWQYLPCDELAGDFLNYFPLGDEHIAAFVVDVSGHGVASSLLSVTVGRVMTPQTSHSTLLAQNRDGEDQLRIVPPAEVAYELNQRFPMEEQNGLYFTLAYGILNTKTLEFRYVNAGHDPLVVIPLDGPPRILESSGFAIGFIEDIDFEEYSLTLRPGDRVCIYSDGVPEAMDEHLEEFGDRQMLEVLELGKTLPVDESVQLLMNAVERWSRKNGPKDDVSILMFEVQQEPSG